MARVTSTEVKAIAADTIPDDVTDLSAFIDVANRMVDRIITDASMTETDKKDVELYLSAHFATLKYRYTVSEKAGSVAESYQHKEDKGLDLTHYGQTAMQLDFSGALAQHNEAIKGGENVTASLTWLGKDRSDA